VRAVGRLAFPENELIKIQTNYAINIQLSAFYTKSNNQWAYLKKIVLFRLIVRLTAMLYYCSLLSRALFNVIFVYYFDNLYFIMNSRVCGFCCKERGDLNQTNWNRHIQAYKSKKIKVNSSFNIKQFFTSTLKKGMYYYYIWLYLISL